MAIKTQWTKIPAPPKMPVIPVRPKPPRPPGPAIFKRGPRGVMPSLKTEDWNLPAPPEGFVGTAPEWAVYWALTKLGYRDGEDFTFQSSQLGVRYEAGAAIVDFLIYARQPLLVIRVQGEYWHYEQGGSRMAVDLFQRQELESKGFEVVDVDEDMVLRDPLFYVRAALEGIEHSRAATRGI